MLLHLHTTILFMHILEVFTGHTHNHFHSEAGPGTIAMRRNVECDCDPVTFPTFTVVSVLSLPCSRPPSRSHVALYCYLHKTIQTKQSWVLTFQRPWVSCHLSISRRTISDHSPRWAPAFLLISPCSIGKIFGNKEMRLLMLGLDAAGKTSEGYRA